MSDQNDARIGMAEQVFDAVVDLPLEKRAEALEQRCGEDVELREFVERLLRIDDLTSAEIDEHKPFQPARGPQPPFRIGRFQVLHTLGAGGMGTVYEARQDHPERIVALKLMQRGVTSRSAMRRFEHESRFLARLRHPGIAQVYEVGVHEADDTEGLPGVPYFAMEYIPSATPITDYAGKKNLSTRERLELFLCVCNAIHHGHQKGIIHRDLKPSNILVDSDGMIKVIDFGVARTTDSDMAVTTMQTDVGQLIGTLQYMSPEQCDADPHEIDIRSDVYALGVVLYELLTEQLPYDVSDARIYEATRIVRETHPARPSAFDRGLRGDLETIVLKALEKERERRYQSAADLASDIRRYLEGRPIEARPPSAMYQFRTFARRNKALVGGVAATFIALIAGLIAVSAMYVQAEHLRAAEAEQRRIAEQREAEAIAAKEAEAQAREEADKVVEFQERQLVDIETAVMGAGIRASILDMYREALMNAGHDTVEVERMLRALEESLASVNFTNIALESLDKNIFERALHAIDEQFGEQPLIKARLLQTVANIMRQSGLLERAMIPQTEALDIRRRALGEEHPDTLLSFNNMGFLLREQAHYTDAEVYLRKAMHGRRRVLGDDHPDTLATIGNYGGVLWSQDKFAEAEPYYREALERSRRTLGDDDLQTLRALINMGSLLQMQRKYAEAEPYYREALDGYRLRYHDDYPDVLTALNNLAVAIEGQGRFAEAEPYHLEVLERRRRVLGDEHPNTLRSIGNIGVLFVRQGKLDKAEQYFVEALEGRRRVYGDEHPQTLLSMNYLGTVLQRMGKLAEAEPYFQESLETHRRVFGTEHARTQESIGHMGVLLREQGRFDEAEPYLREAMKTLRNLYGDEHPDTVRSINNLGALLRDLGNLEEAEQFGAEAGETAKRIHAAGHWLTAVYLFEHARTLAAMERFSEAEEQMLEALELLAASLGEHHPRTTAVVTHIANLYDAWHEAEPNAGHDEKASEWRSKLPEESDFDE